MGKGAGRGGQNEQLPRLSRPKSLENLKYLGKITYEEVKRHRTPGDAWLIIRDKVYDVSSWNEHPGGNVIFTTAGEDATDVFNAFHAGGSVHYLKEFEIGEVDRTNSDAKLTPSAKQVAFEANYRKLRSRLMVDGMFSASPVWYAYKMLTQVAIWLLGFYLAYASNGRLLMVLASGIVHALFLQQSGWLCHDILHHQVFKDRRMGHLLGLVWGNFAQGFSISWWMNKHNSHHAVPNLVESCANAADGDPDIDTMPFLAWSKQMWAQRAEGLKGSAVGRFMIRNQALLYFPLLGMARVSWALQGLQYGFPSMPSFGWSVKSAELTGSKNTVYPMGEKVGLIGHYAWYFTAATLCCINAPGLLSGLAAFALYVVSTNVLCGLFLAIVFGLGHNGMAVYHADDRPDFWKLQVTTTRNIIGGHGIPQPLVDYFCGGLQYQVEHHLFPQIPRHNLPAVHKAVVKFCKDEGVDFHEADIVDGTKEVLQHLGEVADDFIQHFPAL